MDIKEKGNSNKGLSTEVADNLAGPRVAAAVFAVLLLVLAIFVAYASAQSKVILLVEGEQIEVRSFAGDVSGLLQEQGIELGVIDKVTPLLDTTLQDGMTVVVRRAIPVTLQVGEQESLINTAAETVGDLIDESNIALGERDVVAPSLETRLEPDMLVRVDLITVRTVDEEVPVKFNVRRENDSKIARGITSVVQQGTEGLERKSWEITYKNGKEAQRRLVDSVVVKKPVDQIVKVGALQVASRGGQDIRFSRAYDMVSTAYTHTGNNTATGVKPKVGIVAVDPSVIPLGTKLYVEGYGHCRAMDVGSKIKGSRIDVFLETRNEAKRWGVKKVKVYVLE